MKITQYPFNKAQYVQEEYKKTQIYLHHTAGNANPYGVYKDWEKNEERVATCMVVGGKNSPDNSSWVDGEIIQGFASKHWAFHLGLKESTFDKYGVKYQSIDRISIGIEICNWGQLTLKDGKFYNYVNKEVAKEEVVELVNPHRGYKYYHAYTDAQIDAVEEILRILKVKFNIPIKYNPDIWDITTRALKGEPGVYTHNSVRTDKVDVSPQPKLIDMLKSLK